MKRLKVLDQIHVSAVQADALRPGQTITVTNAVASDLLKAHPTKFDDLGDAEDEPEAGGAVAGEKAEQPHSDKIAPIALNKANRKRKTKAG